MKSLEECISKSFLCQTTMVVDQACTLEFSRTEEVSRNYATPRNISATTNKQKALRGKIWWFFHISNPKTAFLMKNLPIDPCNLGIFPNKQCHSFQFPKNSRGAPPPLLPGECWHILRFLCLLPKMPLKFPVYMALIMDGGWNIVSPERQIL